MFYSRAADLSKNQNVPTVLLTKIEDVWKALEEQCESDTRPLRERWPLLPPLPPRVIKELATARHRYEPERKGQEFS